jgi:hypothetical protein
MNFSTFCGRISIDSRIEERNFKIYARKRLAELKDEFLREIYPKTQPTKELIRLKPQEVVEK